MISHCGRTTHRGADAEGDRSPTNGVVASNIWMKRYLGVEAGEDVAKPWAATIGNWVHHWLANIIEKRNGKIFSTFPAPAKIDERIRFAADERCAGLRHLCNLAGKVVPDWWSSGWLNARYLARHLAPKSERRKGGIGWRRSWPSVVEVR